MAAIIFLSYTTVVWTKHLISYLPILSKDKYINMYVNLYKYIKPHKLDRASKKDLQSNLLA